ncbi:hypothetical protein GCM10025865_31540 [Paraoerskovia sediminicola]|uniref:Uncharacterized protein n=1 Tax=Paraoerskovia sediminicola TaxID=1138587 RepID=A0ABN6XGH3_9CELL|nr:hypothetical protein GCM10025865_31540 [Paraoerskovia sediminicola]
MVTGEGEPPSHELEERGVDVDPDLPGVRALVLDPPGERAAGGAEVDGAQARRARREALDQRRHLLHVLEGEQAGVGEVDVGARHAVDHDRHPGREVRVTLEPDVTGRGRDVADRQCRWRGVLLALCTGT